MTVSDLDPQVHVADVSGEDGGDSTGTNVLFSVTGDQVYLGNVLAILRIYAEQRVVATVAEGEHTGGTVHKLNSSGFNLKTLVIHSYLAHNSVKNLRKFAGKINLFDRYFDDR